MRALLLVVLLAPVAGAASAYPDGAQWGTSEASLPLRAAGPLRVQAEPAVEAALAPPGREPAGWQATPATLEAAPGTWRGLEGVSVLWLRRADRESVVLAITDEAREGIALEWPEPRSVPALGLGPLALALASASPLVRGFRR